MTRKFIFVFTIAWSFHCVETHAQAVDDGTEAVHSETDSKNGSTETGPSEEAPPPTRAPSSSDGWAYGDALPGSGAPSCDPYDRAAFVLGPSTALKRTYDGYVERNGTSDGFLAHQEARYRRKKNGGVALMIPGVLMMAGAFALGFAGGYTGEHGLVIAGGGVELLGAAFLVPGIIKLVKGKRLSNRYRRIMGMPCNE